jgi:ketosteroid isomerase-like protein
MWRSPSRRSRTVGAVGESRNIEVVRDMWEAYGREGLEGILAFAATDAEWRPYSARGQVFRTTTEYRRHVEQMSEQDEIVEAKMFDLYAADDWVVVSGRLRIRGPDSMADNPMHWVHRLDNEKIVFTASFTNLKEALDAAGLRVEDRAPA